MALVDPVQADRGRRRAIVAGARVVLLTLALVTGSAAVTSARAAHADGAVLVGVPSPTATEAPRAAVPGGIADPGAPARR